VRLLEDRAFIARNPNLKDQADSFVSFFDEIGSTFEVALADTIDVVQARFVLQFWVRTIERYPGLIWEEE